MLCLGVNIGHDRGAALVEDGKILYAVSQERIDRKKHSSGVTLPILAIDYCLNSSGYKASDIDVVVYNYPHHVKAYAALPKFIKDLKRRFKKTVFVPHHLAHAYGVFFSSPFKESNIMVIDGGGNKFHKQPKDFYDSWLWNFKARPIHIEAETGYYFENKKDPRLLYKRWQTRTGQNQKLSLGRMYWETCKRVGMGILDGGKLMGLSSYGMNRKRFSSLVKIEGEDFDVDLKKIKKMPANSFEEKAKLAGLVQYSLEETLIWMANLLWKKNPTSNLCISGGVGLNSISNELILRNSPYDNIFITPACSDCGIPLGCANYGYYHVMGQTKRTKYQAYLGKEYSDKVILATLKKSKYKYKRINNIFEVVAKLLYQNKIVGWFQGASEYGPRALGNRSILCNPANPDMKDILNSKVKHRESYRPFAPAMIANKASQYFDLSSEEVPYMLQIVNAIKKDKIPAVVHVDGTARLQTVTREQNARFYELLESFEKISGVPVLLNTSFNVAGEPIVETPRDALKCFASTKIDVLVLGNFLINKDST